MAGAIHDCFQIHQTLDKFFIEPITADGGSLTSECLCIDRVNNALLLLPSNEIPSQTESKPARVFGIIGIIRLVAGNYLVVITDRKEVGFVNGHTIYKVIRTECLPYARTTLHLNEQQVDDNRKLLQMTQTFLQTDGFFYSPTYDITHTLQRLQNTSPDFRQMSLQERADQRFVWNQHVLTGLAIFPELRRYALPLLHGFVQTRQCELNGRPFRLTIISRRSVFRAGVRLYTRGIDTSGNVANFVETEQILEFDTILCSFVQTRGSIPLFWNQSPNLKWLPFPKLVKDANHINAFRLHLDSQLFNYGKQVIVNLVNKRGREKLLGDMLENTFVTANIQDCKYVAFDFHKECGHMRWDRLSLLVEQVAADMQAFGYFAARQDGYAQKFQTGVFRTNCMDCLDRTNVVQCLFARKSLEFQLQWLRVLQEGETLDNHQPFDVIYRHLWADNGDMCSVQYAGTGALKADYTRTGQRTTLGMWNDLVNALTRYYRNNFYDGHKQDSIDLFLGNYVIDDKYDRQKLIDDRDWRLYMIPLDIFAFGMFLLTLMVTSADWIYVFLWLIIAIVIFAYVWLNGEEFVNRPRLRQE